MKIKHLLPALFISGLFAHGACAEGDAPSLKADADWIKYRETKPEAGSPHDVMLSYFLAKEKGDKETAGKHLSKTLPDWRVKECLESSTPQDNPIDPKSLNYRLKFDEYTDHWVIRLGYNLESGAYRGTSFKLVWEDEQWKLR